jgi:hypothetical protein
MKTPTATARIATALALVALVGGGIAADQSGSGNPGDAGARATAARVVPIAKRVEKIRQLRFKRYPKPRVVTPAETERISLQELDKQYPPARRRTDQELLTLLGLLEPGTDLREIQGDISGGQVAGFYDTRRKRLAIVSGEGTSDELLTEITLSHELTHALEDQRFGLRELGGGGADDRGSAYTALVEGTATSVMGDYARRYIDPGSALVSALSASGPAARATENIPPYVQESLEFPYTWGAKFVARLRKEGDGWGLVNRALRDRPPASTEQVIHPDKYLAREQPDKLRWRPFGDLLPSGWRRRTGGTMGEFDTYELLALGVDGASAGRAAAGWGGGRYEMWGAPGTDSACKSPCRKRNALVLAWTWDTSADAADFDKAVRSYVEDGLKATPDGDSAWTGGGGAAALSVRGLSTTLAFAPDLAAARRLASDALVD